VGEVLSSILDIHPWLGRCSLSLLREADHLEEDSAASALRMRWR
jgi:hypothetical protein